MSVFDTLHTLKTQLDALRPLAPDQEARIMQKLRLDWNYHSNHLEGNTLTYGETKALILFGLTARAKPLQDHIEMTGHDEAVKWIEEIIHKETPITEIFIRQLHQLVLKERHQKEAQTSDGQRTFKWVEVGVYKNSPNHVLTRTGEMYYFANPEETPAKMTDLIDWFRAENDKKDRNGLLLAAQFHHKFICIHPFDDGNGRVGRLLMNLILMQYGYPPAIIRSDDKANYYAALQQADAGIFEPFFEYIAENVNRSLEIMIKGARGENIEDEDDLDKEIALLEQKMKARKITVFKSGEVLMNMYKTVFLPLLTSLDEYSNKFHFFYKTSTSAFVIGNSIYKMNTKHDILDRLQKAPHHIIIFADFADIRELQYIRQSFTSVIEIIFTKEKYIISNKNDQTFPKIEKRYNDLLTPEEIKSIITFETKRHLEFLKTITNHQ
jgi:Fic family protein